MMFTLTQIEAAQAQVESGKNFPKFAKSLKEMGVENFETLVEDGSVIYRGKDGEQASAAQKYAPILIYGITDPAKFTEGLRNHQQGNTDFFQFCQNCADSGIHKWIVDLNSETCTYYDTTGTAIFTEKIPI